MKILTLIIPFVLLANQSGAEEFSSNSNSLWNSSQSIACIDTYPNLPLTAWRLGISPWERSGNAGYVFRMCNGDEYQIDALINALLDRMEEKSR